jgi:hypothetical protein
MHAMFRAGERIYAIAVVAICTVGPLTSGEVRAQAAAAPKAMHIGDVLTGQLNNLRTHDAKGKRTTVFQVTSEPRRLPAPAGLCNLETGPETFEIVTSSDAQAAQLRKMVGKEVALKVAEVACAEAAGQMSEALVTKWSVVPKP